MIPLLHEAGMMAHVTYTSIQTLKTASGRMADLKPDYIERMSAYIDEAQRADVRITQCITDAKGDRSRPPAKQDDLDAYVRVVDRQRDGVVIRGAKLHITGASFGHDLLTIPTKAMKAGEEEWSIGCIVPVNAEGVKIINTTYAPRHDDTRSFPVSAGHHYPEGFVIFDDVFVPHERVFLDGETAFAAIFAHSLGLWERLGGLSAFVEEADELVGLAQLVAEANGTAGIAHIKEKISEMIIHATLIRAALEAAVGNCNIGPDGAAFPNELFTNAGKFHAAANYNAMVRHVHDIAGGAVLTAPVPADFENADVGHLARKYMSTGNGRRWRVSLEADAHHSRSDRRCLRRLEGRHQHPGRWRALRPADRHPTPLRPRRRQAQGAAHRRTLRRRGSRMSARSVDASVAGPLSPDELRRDVRSWLADHWDPQVPLGVWWSQLADSGWGFPHFPIEWSGRGLSPALAGIVEQEIRLAGAYGPPHGIATMMVAPMLLELGTDEQKAAWLPGIVRGTDVWCQLFSEPGAGSDLAGVSTRAVRDGDEWIVNGQKVWTSGGHYAKRAILVARSDPAQPKHRGLSFFVIEMDQPGVEVRPLVQMTGDAEFNEVFLTDAVVPNENLIGDVGGGWSVALRTLSYERGSLDPEAEAGIQFALDHAEPAGRYASGELNDGTRGFMPTGSEAWRLLCSLAADTGADRHPVFRQQLAQIYSWFEIARFAGHRAAARQDATGELPGPEVSLGKLASVRLMRTYRDVALAMLGPNGLLLGDNAPYGGLFAEIALSVPGMSIAGGTDEIQRNIVGERVLGLPGDIRVDKDRPFLRSKLLGGLEGTFRRAWRE